MFRLYSNENFPLPVVEELRRLGCDVTTVTETGRAGQSWPDEAVLAYAIAESRALLTINRKHFFRLHRTTAQPHNTRPRRNHRLHIRHRFYRPSQSHPRCAQ